MAARDRFGAWPQDPGESQLKRYIRNACDPVNFEPNLALCLEISDLINSKKQNTPREAAMTIVNYINHRNPNVSLLALTLLDICVKNCGYPFHLQISTKDFLNELVRRFPERPPPRAQRVQLKILEAIEEWRQTICMTSRYKEDLGFIRDMHRLLSYKGYTFPEVRREDAAVLNPTDALKSAEEMEEEEREAQSAKLQELIRRGTPGDLQEANHLMKIMAGYDQSSKTDYRAKAAEEVGKLRRKAKLLEEMLSKIQPGQTMDNSDSFEELAGALKTAQPKIQKMVDEESDDAEAVVKLLELNDVINTTVERYALVKKGDINAARALPSVAGGEAQSAAAPIEEDSLIDLGGEPTNGQPSGSATQGGGSLTDDLLGLSIDDPTAMIGSGGGIALGFGANTNIPGPPLLSSTLEASTAGHQAMPSPSASPAPQNRPPNYDPFSSLIAPSAPSTQLAQTPLSAFGTPQQAATPFQPQPAQSAPAPSNGDPAAAPAEDEWSFTSALPVEASAPSIASNEKVLLDTNLRILLEFNRPAMMANGPILIRTKFTNNASQPITDLTFQMAATKDLSLKMEPQSGRMLQAHQKDGVTQIMRVSGVASGQGSSVRMRWKVGYRVGSGPLTEEQGAIDGLPVA